MATSSAARQFVTWAPLAALLVVLLPALAAAQEPAPPAVSAPDKPERLLALDIFGGWSGCCAAIETPGTGEESNKNRRERVGGRSDCALRKALARHQEYTVGRTTIIDVPVWQVTAGPQLYIGKSYARWMAHALVGFSTTSGVTPSQSSVTWVVGGGWMYSSSGSKGTTSGSVSMEWRRTTSAGSLEWSYRCASEHARTTMSPVSSESDLDHCSLPSRRPDSLRQSPSSCTPDPSRRA